jgi:hypothetical protein
VGSGFDLAGALEELEALRDRLNDDKTARKVVAPALLLIQAERLGVNEATLRHFGAVVSGAIDGDGYVSAARREVSLASGEREVALLWGAALAAHGIKAELRDVGRGSMQSRPAVTRPGWRAYTSSTVLHCLKEMTGLKATSWLKPWSWGARGLTSAGRG